MLSGPFAIHPDRGARVKSAALCLLRLLGVSDRALWTWIYERKIEVVRLGRSVRIKQSSLDKMIEQGTTPAKAN